MNYFNMTETEYFTELKKRLDANPDFPDSYLRDIGSSSPFAITEEALAILEIEKAKLRKQINR